ncbi:MAG: AraC family transcriptional regulator ligand-binding domain-containing protein [Halioglobus sp.]
MDSISPVYARFVLREILRQGISTDELLAGTRLNRRELETGGDIAVEDFLAILENGRKLSGNERLGLIIGRHTNIIALGQIGAAAAIAPTVREGLQVMENYTRLHVSYMRLELVSSLQGLSVRFLFLKDTGVTEMFHTETALMLVQHYVETLTGRILDNARHHLRLPAPDYASEYSYWLHSPVSFNAEYCFVALPFEWLDLPSPYYNAEMWQQANQMLAQQMQEMEGKERLPYSQYVDTLLRSNEPPLPDLRDAAAKLHISERTLNRRLQQEGTNFRQIKGQILGSWARQHLRETKHSVEAIAAELGYQDAANFRRAFRNSEGCSPSEFRRAMAVTPNKFLGTRV